METDELRKVLDDAPDGPWLLSEQTLYTLRPTKWAGLDTFENAWQAQFSQDGQYKTPLTEVMAAARLCQMAPDLAAEAIRLRIERDDWQSRALFAEAQLEAVLEQLPPPEKDLLQKRLAERAKSRKPICATDGCDRPSVIHFIRGDVGSHYCRDCYSKIQITET